MTDVHNKETRSYNMSRIKGKDTKPEMLVRKFLFAQGFRYRLHVKTLPGKPDIVLPKYKTAIFIHGCFFHGHDSCKYFKWPKDNSEFWLNKITNNKKRDTRNFEVLRLSGWNVIAIFECQLNIKHRNQTLQNLINQIICNLVTHE